MLCPPRWWAVWRLWSRIHPAGGRGDFLESGGTVGTPGGLRERERERERGRDREWEKERDRDSPHQRLRSPLKSRSVSSLRSALEVELGSSPGGGGGSSGVVGRSPSAGRLNGCSGSMGLNSPMTSGGPASPDSIPSTPGKVKEKTFFQWSAPRVGWSFTSIRIAAIAGLLLIAGVAFTCRFSAGEPSRPSLLSFDLSLPGKGPRKLWGGPEWEQKVKLSGRPRRPERLVVLVTGAAGFVGSHLALALKKRGDGVVGLDNFNSYYDPALKRDRQEHLRQHSIFIAEGDINDGELLTRLFQLVQFSHVAHMAAQAGVRYALENPASYIHSNVAGWVSVLEACKRAVPQPAIVWASSSSVYGLNTKVPFSETDRTDQPASLYAATKKAGEEIAHTYNHIYGLSLTALRFFTVYGPWGRPDMAYFSFTQNILDGKLIKVYQGVNKTDLARDFTYIDDIIRGCVAALDTALASTGSGGKKRGPAQLRTFNLGNTQPVSVPDLVSLLERQLKVKAQKHFVKMPRNGDVPFTHANVTRAQLELAYRPSTNLKTGVKQFVKWYMSYYGDREDGVEDSGRKIHSSVGKQSSLQGTS